MRGPSGFRSWPLLVDIFYDDLLSIPILSGIELIAFADDVVVVGTTKDGFGLEVSLSSALNRVSAWMASNSLSLAANKTVTVLLIQKWRYRVPQLRVSGYPIAFQNSIMYLVELDRWFAFCRHSVLVLGASPTSAVAILRLMPNVRGPSASKSKFFLSVVHSKILYACSIWAPEALRFGFYRQALVTAQRTAVLRIIWAYRTVLDKVTLLLARAPPVDLLALERANIRARVSADNTVESVADNKSDERRFLLAKWVSRWSNSTKTNWTR